MMKSMERSLALGDLHISTMMKMKKILIEKLRINLYGSLISIGHKKEEGERVMILNMMIWMMRGMKSLIQTIIL